MNFEYVRSFIETTRHTSIVKASEKLNISHTALSKQIRKLEEYFQVQLFRRSSSGVELTEEGKILYSRIVPILQEFDFLRADLFHMQQFKQSYTIATLPTIALYVLPPILLKLEQQFLKIDLQVRHTSLDLIELLEAGEIDCAIIDTDVSSRFSWAKELYKERLYIVLDQNHSLATHTSIQIHEVLEERFVVFPEQCSIRNKIENLFAARGKSITISSQVSYGELILGFVAAGAGITVAPESQTKHLGYSNLKAIPLNHPEAYRSISMVSVSEAVGRRFYRDFKAEISDSAC